MEVTIIDAAAFHQYIAGAQAYFDFLHKAKSGGHFSPQVVAHRARALRIINSKVAKPETAGSDGVIASVVLFARYYVGIVFFVMTLLWKLTHSAANDRRLGELEDAYVGPEANYPFARRY